MSKRMRNLLLIAGGVIVLIGLAVVAGRRGGSQAVTVPTQKLAATTFAVKLPENGTVMHPRAATIPTLVAGNIGHIYARSGQNVAAGELLATIDNPTLVYNAAGSQADYTSQVANVEAAKVQQQNATVGYKASVDTNKAALDDAQRVYNEDVELYNNKAIPRSQLDADRTKLKQAQVAYDQALEQQRLGAVTSFNGSNIQYAIAAARKAQIVNDQNQQQLGFTHITAPFAGIIQTVATEPNDALRSLQSGDAVTEGQTIFTIASGNGYIVKAQVDEQDVINVRLGQPANISGQDFPGKTIRGHVSEIAPVAVKSTDASSTAKQVLTTITLDNSPSYLKDGMTVDVDILTTYVPNAIVVPNDALIKEKGKTYVYVVENGAAHKTEVRVGKASDTQTMILSGLHPGQIIVPSKVPLLADGKKVTAASPSPSSSPTSGP